MKSTKRKPGRPRKADALSAAQRMHLMRERRRKAGLQLKQSWVGTAPAEYSDHQRLDARSLALHFMVARRLMADPDLIKQAGNTLSRWKQQAPQPPPSYFAEWNKVLQRSPRQIAGFLLDMGEQATRLRQSSPFSVLVTPEERDQVYATFR